MPDPDRLLRTLYKAAEAVRQTPGRKGRFVQLTNASEVLVAGDLHGHIGNFQAVHKAAALDKNPRRHLVLQEVIHGKQKYPQGGDKSHQLLDLFSALKCQFPTQVHMLLGNHEMAQWANRVVLKEDRDLNAVFLDGVREAYGPDKGAEIYQTYMRLFSVLPFALRTANRIFISHSLPRQKAIETFEVRHLQTDAFPPEELTVGGSVYELLWGRDTRAETCAAFLKKVDCDWLVSGHISLETGYVMPSPQQIILDCCDHPAAYALLPADRPISKEEFKGSVRMLEAVG
jgi:Calcineurin-like phosphoesterase